MKNGRLQRFVLVAQVPGVIGASPDLAVASDFQIETPRELCIQAIQTATLRRTDDLFNDIYLPDGRQKPQVLFQIATHQDYGDTFIDRGEELFLAKRGLEPAAECTSEKVSGIMTPQCSDDEIQDLLVSNASVYFQGGGNWGDLWRSHHLRRMEEIAHLATREHMTIVTMPQSLHFGRRGHQQADSRRVAAIVDSKHPTTRLVFFFRQRDSYETARLMYPGVDVRLVPDLAFLLGPQLRAQTKKFTYDILFLTRYDKEESMGSGVTEFITSEMQRQAPGVSFYVGDWQNTRNDEDTWLYLHNHVEPSVAALRASAVVEAGIRQMSTAKVVVTTRFHGSILALLLGIPHVVIDGGKDSASYGKRKLTRAAAFEASEHCTQENLRYVDANSTADGIVKGLQLLEKYWK